MCTTVYGIAVDDAHTFKDPGNPTVSAPGRGWVTVRAPRLDAGSLSQRGIDGGCYRHGCGARARPSREQDDGDGRHERRDGDVAES